MSNRQAEIAAALDVVPPFADDASLERRNRKAQGLHQESPTAHREAETAKAHRG